MAELPEKVKRAHVEQLVRSVFGTPVEIMFPKGVSRNHKRVTIVKTLHPTGEHVEVEMSAYSYMELAKKIGYLAVVVTENTNRLNREGGEPFLSKQDRAEPLSAETFRSFGRRALSRIKRWLSL